MHGDRQRPTIRAVAREAGVSVATVSRVLNGRGGVEANKRHRVLAVVDRLGYRPSELARRLSAGSATRIGFNVGAGSELIPFNVLLRDRLAEVFAARSLFLETIRTDPTGLPERLADAMVIGSVFDDDPRIARLQEANVPFVVYGTYPDVAWVSSDDYAGGKLAAEHLLRLGHEELLFVTAVRAGLDSHMGARYTHMFQERYEGFHDALASAGIELRAEAAVDGRFTALGAFLAVRDAMREGVRFSAVFALSDRMAQGAITAIEDAGLSVPGDISVIGFDDEPGQLTALTTIRQDVGLLAQEIADLLQVTIEGAPARGLRVPVRLVQRGTTSQRRSGVPHAKHPLP